MWAARDLRIRGRAPRAARAPGGDRADPILAPGVEPNSGLLLLPLEVNMANFPTLPAMPSFSGARRLSACYCGCGGVTARSFCPGHDSTLKAWVIRVERGVIAIGDIGHEGLTKAVRATVESRARGKNVSFMANVALPVQSDKKVG